MRSKLRLTLAAVLTAAATAALANDRGSLSEHDDVDHGDAPTTAPAVATVQAADQDDSRMLPPAPAPGTEDTSGVTTDVEYDATRMVPAEQ